MCRSRGEVSNEYFLAKSASIQPRRSPPKFQVSFPPRQLSFTYVSHTRREVAAVGRALATRDALLKDLVGEVGRKLAAPVPEGSSGLSENGLAKFRFDTAENEPCKVCRTP